MRRSSLEAGQPVNARPVYATPCCCAQGMKGAPWDRFQAVIRRNRCGGRFFTPGSVAPAILICNAMKQQVV